MALDRFHALTSNNFALIHAAGGGVCVHCGRRSTPMDMDWTDAGQTALCSACGVSAIVPFLTPSLLARLHQSWFRTQTHA